MIHCGGHYVLLSLFFVEEVLKEARYMDSLVHQSEYCLERSRWVFSLFGIPDELFPASRCNAVFQKPLSNHCGLYCLLYMEMIGAEFLGTGL
jgi:hypothetical protein